MVTHQQINRCLPVLAAVVVLQLASGPERARAERQAAAVPSPTTTGTALVTVGPNVQISASMPSTMHGEGLIIADPTNENRLLVCSMFRDPEMGEGVAVYLSEDGGARWHRTFESGAAAHAGDPACAFGSNGTAYLMMIPLAERAGNGPPHLPLLRSVDGGHTWVTVARTGLMDRESLVVDRTSGPFRNRV